MAQHAISPSTAPHIHADGAETCPYCQQDIPNDRVVEIRERVEADKRQKEMEFAARVDAQVVSIRTQLDEARKTEIKALTEQHAAAIEKQRSDALLQQTAAREDGKKLATAALQPQIDTLTAAQTASAEKTQELEEKRLEAETKFTALQAQQEANIKARTDEVRFAMEAQKVEEINAVNAKNAADAKVLNDKIASLQKLVDSEEAEGADIKILEQLKKEYPKDDSGS